MVLVGTAVFGGTFLKYQQVRKTAGGMERNRIGNPLQKQEQEIFVG